MTFQEMGLSHELLEAIEDLGFVQPMPVQEKVIPHLLNSNTDLIALAQTGTGKTAAFGLPILQQINTDSNILQALILSPTRELCIQIADDLIQYGKNIEHLNIVPVYGGASIDTQIRALNRGSHIVVATPGRLKDMIERKAVSLHTVEKLVLDEADEMLTMGFTESIDAILSYLPKHTNKFLFSATMPIPIANIAKKYMRNATEITIGNKNSGADNIKHICYTVQAKDKYATLKRIADYYPNIYGIVFCRTRKETQEIADSLIRDGYNAEPLHGDLSQGQRDSVMNKFRSKTIQLLVATDVAARGIDVDDLTHIINYNLPEESDAYNHRSGRTGRAGKHGVSIAIINLKEKYRIKNIEKKIGKEFLWEKVPNGKDVCEKQLFHLIEIIEHIEIEHDDIEPFLPIIFKKLGWLEKEDLIKRLVSVEFNRFLQYYRNAEDLNIIFDKKDKSNKKDFSKFDKNGTNGNYAKLFINIGKTDGFHPSLMIDTLNRMAKGVKFRLGKISLFKNHSIFEVDSSKAEMIISAINGQIFDDRTIVVKYDSISSSYDNYTSAKSRFNKVIKKDRQKDTKQTDKKKSKKKS